MYLDFPVQMAIYAVSAAMSVAILILFFVKGRKSTLLYSFILFQAIILIWLLRIIILKLKLKYNPVLGNDFSGFSFEYYELYHYKLKHFIVCFTGLCWLLFCLLFSRVEIKKHKYLYAGLPIAALVVFCIPVYLYDLWYKYDYTHKTLLIWLHAFSRYLCFVIGIAVLIKWCITQKGYIRKQSILLAISVVFPVALNYFQDYKRFMLDQGGIIYDFDVTPVGFILTMAVIAVATYSYRFLNIVPLAHKRLVDNMNQAIVVTDSFNRVIDFNRSFLSTFLTNQSVKKNTDIGIILEAMKKAIPQGELNDKVFEALENRKCTSYKGELVLSLPEPRYYMVEVQSLETKGKEILYRVISFNDITEYKQLLNEINQKNFELTRMYDQIKEYAAATEELAITKERNRFAKDIHDTLGHTLTLLIALLEVSNITVERDIKKTRDRLSKALEISRAGLREIRRSISGLVPEKLDDGSLVKSLERLISDFRSSDIDVDFTIDGAERNVDRMTLEILYRACQEAMTNSIRHGLARHIDVILKFYEDRLKLFIIDDGCGSNHIKKGFGLSGMEERIKTLGGKVNISSDGESGFNVHLEVPVSKKPVMQTKSEGLNVKSSDCR